jgi:RDD family
VRPSSAPGPPAGREPPLAEFPLDPGPESAAPGTEATGETARADPAASLGIRALAAAADLAATVLGVSLPIVAAAIVRERWPTSSGLLWAAAFALTLSFAATVAALFLFGRTVGMALAGLSIRSKEGGRRPTAGEAVSRWLGLALTVATLGVALLLTVADRDAPTPADRLSGRPLVEDES